MPIPLKVLLLEDREEDALLVLHALKQAGFEPDWQRVDTQDDFSDALDPSLDVILADYHLPGWSGLSALAMFQARGLDIPFIIVSGTIGEEIAVDAMRRGAADYLLKDRLTRLGPAVLHQLELKRLREDARTTEAAYTAERQRAEDALRESETLYRDLVENSRYLICTHDEGGNLLSVNEAAARLTGYTRQRLLRMNMADLLAPDVRDTFDAYLNAIWSTGSSNGVIKIRTASGEVRFWDYDCTLRTEGVTAPIVRGIAHDVTERRQAVDALRDSEERHRLLFQSSPLPMWVYDVETLRFLAVNKTALSHYGYSEAEFLAMTLRDIRPPEDLPRLYESLAAIVPGVRQSSVEPHRHRKKNGEIIDVEVSADSLVFDCREARLVLALDITERKQAEEALRLSEQKYRDIIDFAPIGFYQATAAGRFAMVNQSLAEMFGYAPEEASEIDIARQIFQRPEERQEFLSTLESQGAPGRVELCLRRKNGTLFWVEVNARVLTDASGRTNGVEGFVTNIDNRKRAEQALFESEERYRTVVEGADEVIYTISPDGLLTSVNPAFERSTGWSKGEWIGRPFWEVIDESALGLVQKSWSRLLSGGSVAGADLWLRTRNGGVCVLQSTSSPTIKDGEVVQISGIGRDVTEQRRMEREREVLTRRLELVLESTDEGLFAVDLNGLCTMVNRSANRLLGYERGELIGQHMHTAVHHTKADGRPFPASECTICPATRIGETVRAPDDLFWTKGGLSFPVESACSPIFEGDAITGSVVTFSDISVRSSLEKQLAKANRLTSLGRLAATVAHEFNNVLMGIQPFAEVIARSAAHQENLVEAAGHISSSVKRGRRITQDILRFTQPAQPVLQPIGVESWLRDLEVEARSLLPRDIELVVKPSSPQLGLVGDSSQLQQVFVNLMLNAKDAMPHGGCLTISATVDGDDTRYPFGFVEQPSRFVRITVSDKGSGMTSETLHHIFEPLFTTKITGTGLGLAVTHQIVKHHGGEIFVESTVGVGTSFHLFIPRSNSGPEVAAPVVEELQRPAARTRLLLVEDDPSVSKALLSILALEGFQVDAVDRGALAVDAVKRFLPDAVILDVGLPDMSGIDVYHQIVVTWPGLPVLFSTGAGDVSKLEELLERANVGYLLKPYEIEELLDLLARLIPGEEVT